MERSIFRASLLGSNGTGNSPKRKLEIAGNDEDDSRPIKKQKLVSDSNIDNFQDREAPEDDFDSFFEGNLPTDETVNTNSNVLREDRSEENSNNNNTNYESGDKDVDEEGLESLEELNLSPALFDDSDDIQNDQLENSNGDLTDSNAIEIKDDEVLVAAHKNTTSAMDIKRAHPNDDDDFDMKHDMRSNPDEKKTDISVEQTEGERDLIGDLILSAEGEDPVVKVVAAINRKLRPYQREGVKFLYTLYRDNKGGILGDDMGLGKTVQTISFISAILVERKKPVFAFNLGDKTVPTEEEKQKFRPVLVIAPSGVVMNWEREFQNWGKLMGRTFAVHRYMGPQRDLSIVQKGNVDVVLSSYDTFRRDFDLINTIDWACIVFDEVHKVKDRKAKITVVCKQLRTKRRYGLTGTVMQNNFEELWTLLDFVQEGCLDTLESFRKKFINVIKNGQRRDATPIELAKSKVVVKRLNRILKGVILRRDQSIIKDLLPGKDDNIVFCQLSELQLKIYKKLLQSQELQMLIKLKDKCACGSGRKGGECCLEESAAGVPWKQLVFPSILTLQKIANHPGLLLAKTESKSEAMPDFVRRSIAEFIPDIKQMMSESKHDDLCGKMRTLSSLLNIWSTQNKKVLLFSYSTRMLDILEQFIKLNNYSYSRLDGAMGIVDRQREMDTFNKQNAQNKFIFLISTKAGGLGLNITSASIVVVFDASWNVTNDLQAQDRAYRIGQTKYTHVYRLVSAGTIEEMVYNRQIYKQQMASIGVEGRHERRYFTGVLGVKGSEGEIFGLANLLKLNTDKILTSEIIKGAQEEERKQYRIEKRQAATNTDSTQDLMKQVLDENLADDAPVEILDLDDLEGRIAQNSNDDGLAKLMRENGVVYAHNNKQILGDSEFERKIAEDAARVFEREERLRSIMSGTDLSTTPLSAADLNLNPQPYAGLSPQMYRQLSPEYQRLMAPFVQKTTIAGLSSSSHPAVSSLHPEKGRPSLQFPRFTAPSYLPKNFEKQQQLITISSEESDDDDDDVQIDSRLSTPRVFHDINDLIAKQRSLLSHPSEASRIPLPQQQLHSNLAGARPFMPTLPLPGSVHQPVQAVQHRGIPPVSLPPLNLGIDTSQQFNFNSEAMARLQKYNLSVPPTGAAPSQAPNPGQPAMPSTAPQLQTAGPVPTHPLINSTAAANNAGGGVTAANNGPGMNQFRAMFPQHNFDSLLPKNPPSISTVVNTNQTTGNAQSTSGEKPSLAAQVIDID